MTDMPSVPLLPEWEVLPGTFRIRATNVHGDAFVRNQVAILVEHDVSPAGRPHSVRYAGMMYAHPALLTDPPALAASLMGIDRHIRPWLYRDRAEPWPTFDLFPRASRAVRMIRRAWERLHDRHPD